MGYFSPTTLDEALEALDTGAMSVIAGGTDWFPMRGDRPVTEDLLDVTRIDGLRGISAADGGGWRIGAATRWTDVIRADLPAAFDGLKLAAREVGSVQIQNAGTVAGNLVNASPAADGVPPLLTLDAQVELASVRGRRKLPLAEFITGVRRTALQPGEIVIALHVPALPAGAGSGFLKAGTRKYLVISISMVAALVAAEGGTITEARVAVGSCSPVARRLPDLEAALKGAALADMAGIVQPAHLSPLAPIADVRGSVEYRLETVAELCRRTLTMAADDQGARNG